MSNKSGEKKMWNQIDAHLSTGLYVLKMDGSNFGAFRLPNVELSILNNYYEIVTSVAFKVLEKFQFFQACYVIDDEFHFLFHTNDIEEKLCRISKVVVLPTSYTTALVNKEINKDNIESRIPIKFKELCYDGRLIKLGKKEIVPYFVDLIDHGKMFIGNITVGDGKHFVQKTMEEILSRAVELKVNVTKDYGIVFGRLIDGTGTNLKLNDLDLDSHKDRVIDIIRSYRTIRNTNKEI